MSYGPSQEELDWLKKSDYLLLKLAYQKAVEAGKSQFKVHVSGFEGSPRAMHHIAQFALSKGLSYENNGMYFIFHKS